MQHTKTRKFLFFVVKHDWTIIISKEAQRRTLKNSSKIVSIYLAESYFGEKTRQTAGHNSYDSLCWKIWQCKISQTNIIFKPYLQHMFIWLVLVLSFYEQNFQVLKGNKNLKIQIFCIVHGLHVQAVQKEWVLKKTWNNSHFCSKLKFYLQVLWKTYLIP